MGPPTATQRRGVWEPLSLIVYGYATHPLTPAHNRDTRVSSKARLSTVTEGSNEDAFSHRDVVALEVGDEVYAFEKYVPIGKECEGIWYRGCVVIIFRCIRRDRHFGFDNFTQDMWSAPLADPP